MSNYKLVPIPPTPEMVEAAEEAYMPFGDMDLAIRMAVLTAPAVQGEPVATLLIDEPERTERGLELGDWDIAPDATAIEAFARLAGPGAYQLYLAPQPAEQKPAPHTDDDAVDRFAVAMKDKLAASREKGRHGWQNATAPHLSALLYDHLYKADPLDVGNLAMMLHQNGQAIELMPQPAPDVEALVEALEQVMHCNEVGFLPEIVQQAVSDSLAAYREQQGDTNHD